MLKQGSRKLVMLAMVLAVLVGLGFLAWLGLPSDVALGLAGQLPFLLGTVVAGNAAEHVSKSRGSAP